MSIFRWFDNLRIRYKLFATYSAVLLLVVAIGIVTLDAYVRKAFTKHTEAQLEQSTEMVVRLIRTAAAVSIKNNLRAVAESNRDMVDTYYRQAVAGKLTESEAKEAARSVLLHQRVGKTGYIFVWDVRKAPESIILAVHPSLQGRDVSGLAFVREGARLRNGYMEYRWKNPGESQDREKAMYLAYFEPWQWVIAVSSYKDEFLELIKVEDFKDSILSVNLDGMGYCFVIDSAGNLVVHPKLQGNAYSLVGESERLFLREMCSKKKGMLAYTWRNPGENTPRPKLAVFDYIPEYDWIVASSSYRDALNIPLYTVRNIVLLSTGLIVLLVLAISFVVGRFISAPLQRLVGAFECKNLARTRLPVESRDEIGRLTLHFNRFMDRLDEESIERIAAEHALRESEEKFKTLFKSSPDALLFASLEDESIHEANEAACRLFGYAREEFVGRTEIELGLWHPAEEHRAVRDILDVQGSVRDYECHVKTRSGAVKTVLLSIETLDLEGRRCMLVVVKDITERKQAEEALAEEAIRRGILIEQSRDGIVVLDEEGAVYESNQSFADMLGYSAEEVHDLHVWDWDAQWTREELQEQVRYVGPEGNHFETRHRRKDGSVYDVEISTNGAFVAGQKLVFCVCRDITERKRAEEALRESEQRVRMKLESILSPEGDIGTLELADIVDVRAIQSLMEDFYKITRFPVSIVDLSGTKLVSVGEQKICTKFHRVHPQTCRSCIESDTQRPGGVLPGTFKLYKCKNGIWEIVTPIVVGGQHVGNLFLGQFFFEDEAPDRECFRSQAQRCGFKESEYLAAFEEVPRLSREFVEAGMAFTMELSRMLSLLSYSNIKLGRALTDRATLMDSLRESQERLNLALAASQMGVWEWDQRSDSFFWSPECYEIVGVEGFRPNLASFLSMVHPEDVEHVLTSARQALGGRAAYREEYRIARPDGTTRWVANLGRAKYDEAGNPLQLVGTIQDITERKQAEEDRKTLESQLRQAQKMEAIGTLAGGIAHDFNNILAAIIGYTELSIRDSSESSPLVDNLRQILKASFRAKELVKQILAFSRKAGEQERAPIDILPLLREAVKFIRASLPTTIEIRHAFPSEPLVALVDPTQIHQVLINLCTNAAHAMEETGGVLEVGAVGFTLDPATAAGYPDLEPGSYIRLSVSDTGHGMDKATLERIFDPYFTTKAIGKGSGLGLAVVHGIVKRHHGAVRVHSKPGEGSIFHVLLPRIDTLVSSSCGGAQQVRGGKESILLVDDEKEIQLLVSTLLERLGYCVASFSDPVEALEAFRRSPERFDLILTDFTMPRMTGEKLAMECLRIRSDIPVVLCTGFSERMDEARAAQIGIRELVLKPLSLNELGSTVRRALDSRASDSSL